MGILRGPLPQDKCYRGEACKQRTLETGEGVAIDPEIRRCSWIEQAVTITDPDGGLTSGVDVTPASPKVPFVAHVENPQAGRNTIGVILRRPGFLGRLLGKIKIRMRGRQAELLPQLARCDLIRGTLCLRQVADDTYEVSEIAEIDQTRGFSFEKTPAWIGSWVRRGFTRSANRSCRDAHGGL